MSVKLGDTTFKELRILTGQRIYELAAPARAGHRIGVSCLHYHPDTVSTIKVIAGDQELVIDQNTLANPTVVRTTVAHGLVTGESVEIRGSNSTPLIDGSRVVTVTDATHFTVAVNVSGAGTAGECVADTEELSGLMQSEGTADSKDAVQIGNGAAFCMMGSPDKKVYLVTTDILTSGGGVAVLAETLGGEYAGAAFA